MRFQRGVELNGFQEDTWRGSLGETVLVLFNASVSDPEKIEAEKGAKEPSRVKKFKAEQNKKFLHELHTCKKSINQMKLIRFMASKASRHFF